MTTEEKIASFIENNPVILFMKGTPDEPKCGFSAAAVAALRGLGIAFAFVNVLAAPRIREALPKVSSFPTFPQLYVRQELVGGSDIVVDMARSGALLKMIQSTNSPPEATL